MGKGDKKSRRGKIIIGTFGVRRPKKSKQHPEPENRKVKEAVKPEKKSVKEKSSAREVKPRKAASEVKPEPAVQATPRKKKEEK